MNEKGITLHYSIALQLHYLKRVFEKSSQNISPKRFFPRQERSSIFGFPLKFHYSCKRTHNMIFSASYSVMSTFLKYCTKDLKKNMSLVLVYFKIEAVVSFWWIPWPYTKNTYLCIVYIVFMLYVKVVSLVTFWQELQQLLILPY